MHVCCCCRMQRGPRSSQSQPSFLSNFSLSLLFNFRGRLLPLRAHDDRRQNLITEITLTGKPSVIWHGVWLCRRPAYRASKPAFNTAAGPRGNYTSDSERLNARRLGTFSIQLAMVPAARGRRRRRRQLLWSLEGNGT